MTSYHISIGYNSGDSCDNDLHQQSKAWELLKTVVLKICENTDWILAEARKFNTPEYCDKSNKTLQEFVDKYKLPWDDLTISINEEQEEIVQMASGDRKVKEHVRRAFCRLVLLKMHEHNVEINISVI